MKDLQQDTTKIAIKQFLSFCIDIGLVSLPLIIYPTINSLIIFGIIWFFYMPLCEYYLGQTLGMKIVGTKIYASTNPYSKVRFITILRRHVSRISIVWGVLGWFSLLGGQFFKDYVIVSENSISHNEEIDEELLGFVKGSKYAMGVIYSLMGWSIK